MQRLLADSLFALATNRGTTFDVGDQDGGVGLASVSDSRYQRLLHLALELGDQEAFEPALAAALRKGDHKAGRALINRFERHRLIDTLQKIPKNTKSLSYRGVRLLWDERVARLFAACSAEHVLPVFEDAFPDDARPRNAIETARRFAIGEASGGELESARAAAGAAAEAAWAASTAAWAAWESARAARAAAAWAAARAAAEAAGATAEAAAWAAGAAAEAAWAPRDSERNWQRERLADFLLGVEVTCTGDGQ